MQYSNGNLLEGRWEVGKRSGTFLFTFPNGQRYTAEYEAGQRLGDWAETDPAPPNLALLAQ